MVVVVVVVVLHLHRVNKGWQLFFFFRRLKFDEESIGDGLKAQKILLFPLCVFSGAVATALNYNDVKFHVCSFFTVSKIQFDEFKTMSIYTVLRVFCTSTVPLFDQALNAGRIFCVLFPSSLYVFTTVPDSSSTSVNLLMVKIKCHEALCHLAPI